MKKRIYKGLFKLFLLIGIGLFAFFGLVYLGAFGHIPNAAELKNIQNALASEVYSEDGKLIGKYFLENRTKAEFDELPQSLIDALVATEDARFYEHNGIDFKSFIRVVFKSLILQDRSSGGGSTLSQQLAKNIFGRAALGSLTMPVAKIKEWILAVRLEKVYSKEEILSLYLNTVSFGENVYGIETASQRYFSTKPKNLSVAQSAILVGILKANTFYNPHKNPENANKRKNVVLHQMAKYGYLPLGDTAKLKSEAVEIRYNNIEKDQPAAYFMRQLESQVTAILKDLKKENGDDYNLLTDGLIIQSTLDSKLQDFARQALYNQVYANNKKFQKQAGNSMLASERKIVLKEMRKTEAFRRLSAKGLSDSEILREFEKSKKRLIYQTSTRKYVHQNLSIIDSILLTQRLLHASFLAIEPQSGEIKAYVGGIDHNFFPYDLVTAKRQAASTFKPFVYGAALENGFSPCDFLENTTATYDKYDDYTPENAGGDDGKLYSLKGALKKSLNVVSVQLGMKTGLENVADYAERCGIESELERVPSMALGTNSVSLLEMVHAYSTIANFGSQSAVFWVNKITDQSGKVIYEKPTSTLEEKLDPEKTEQLVKMMEGVINEGTGASARSLFGLQKAYAGKTGTSQNFADAWFIGFSPNLVAGTWTGAFNPNFHLRHGGSGAASALPIWANFFRKIENSRTSKLYTGSFDYQTEDTIACPDFREKDLLDKLDMWFKNDSVFRSQEKENAVKKFFKGIFKDKN